MQSATDQHGSNTDKNTARSASEVFRLACLHPCSIRVNPWLNATCWAGRVAAMIASAGMRKILAFGLLGAVGCLAAWALGEGLLAAAPAAPGGTSLVAPPDPDAPPPGAA